MEKILRDLVAFPSVCGDIPEALRIITFVSNYLEQRGMHVQRYTRNGFPSIVATPRSHIMESTVMLAAHLDVTPATPELFTLRKDDGNYYGRGVFDMKFAAAAYLQIVDDLRDRLDNYDFGIMFTTDEELYGPYGTGMLVKKGYHPKVCVIPDASENWNIETVAKGRFFAEIKVPGKSAHGARPWEGDSANSRLVTLLHQLHDLFSDAQQPHTDTLNIGIIQGGTIVNQIAEDALAHVDIRYVDKDAFAERLASIEALCRMHNATFTLISDNAKPVFNSMDNPYIKAFTDCITDETGIAPQSMRSFGASDARFFAEVGIPCVVTSPSGGGRHAPEEWLDATGFEQFPVILHAYLDKVALRTTDFH
jgi:succinyl-diaminopimelate desuccinylase